MTQIETLELLVKTLQEQNLHYQQTTALQAEANKQLTEKVDQLLSQIAWLNRQLFGRKS